MMRTQVLLAASSFVVLLCGCPKDNDQPMTSAEARDAVDESAVSSQASALQSSSIEISTGFTIGKGVQQAAEEVRSFITTQLPCAEVTLADSTLTVVYGAKPGSCVYNGHTFSGSHSIHVEKNDDNQVLVDHTWTEVSNGIVKLTGTAHVTWDFSDKFRHVTYDTSWTRIADGRTGKGTGDVTQKPLAGGIEEGIQIDGQRSWEGKSGKWELNIEGVQARWEDPVPQAGTYRLATPKNRSLSLGFERVDGTTIQVTLSNGTRSFKFSVKGPAADVTDEN